MLKLALTPKWWGSLLLALALATIFVLLSQWQVNRAQERDEVIGSQGTEQVREFNDVMTAGEPLPSTTINQRVRLSGRFVPEQQVIVPGRLLEGKEGYWVVTMFLPDDARSAAPEIPSKPGQAAEEDLPVVVPVVRGWAADADTARASRVSEKPTTLEARIGPVEAPAPSEGLAEGEASTVSTAELVNRWDVRSYSGVVFPSGTGSELYAEGVTTFPPPKMEQEEGLNWQSVVYAIEWIVFAAFALYIWWRLLRDEYLRRLGGEPEDIGYEVVKEAGERYRDG